MSVQMEPICVLSSLSYFLMLRLGILLHRHVSQVMYRLSPSKSYWASIFLHAIGIIHGGKSSIQGVPVLIGVDLHPRNILLASSSDAHSEASLEPGEWCPVKWLEGVPVDDGAPRYLITSQRKEDQLKDADYSTLTAKICDFCGGKLLRLSYFLICLY